MEAVKKLICVLLVLFLANSAREFVIDEVSPRFTQLKLGEMVDIYRTRKELNEQYIACRSPIGPACLAPTVAGYEKHFNENASLVYITELKYAYLKHFSRLKDHHTASNDLTEISCAQAELMATIVSKNQAWLDKRVALSQKSSEKKLVEENHQIARVLLGEVRRSLQRNDLPTALRSRYIQIGAILKPLALDNAALPVETVAQVPSVTASREPASVSALPNVTPDKKTLDLLCNPYHPEKCAEFAQAQKERGNSILSKELSIKACQWKHADSCFTLAQDLDEMSPTEAAPLFKRACDLGSIDGCQRYGNHVFKNGNEIQAEIYWTRSCNASGADGCLSLGNLRLTQGKTNDAIEYFNKICNSQVGLGCVRLGYAYLQQEKTNSAMRSFETGCASGDPEACRQKAKLTPPEDPHRVPAYSN